LFGKLYIVYENAFEKSGLRNAHVGRAWPCTAPIPWLISRSLQHLLE
jgi:hypothetical protein